MTPLHYQVNDLQATCELAEKLAACVQVPLTIACSGTLGAGKTQFIRFFAAALDVHAEEVTSPTYVLLQRYRGRVTLYHFDFYRLENEDQVWDLGIDELMEQPVLTLIEWSDKFPNCLPDDHLQLHISVTGDSRQVTLTALGPRSWRVLECLR